MDQEAFEALIARTEALAAGDPQAYRRRVFGLAVLGYLYLAFVVLVLLGLLAATIASVMYLKALALKLVLPIGASLLLVLRALWVKLVPPVGVRLTPGTSPALHRMLDELRLALATPRLHRVLLTEDFNAGITQVPRLGLFGWHRNYLLIGLPLMKALSLEQFRAVLAHELGHLAGGHSRAANWIYRLRVIWQRLNDAFTQRKHLGSALIEPFFKRYIPYFTAVSFPLARADEYEADAAAVRLTSARSAAQALTSTSLMRRYLAQRYWPGIYATAKDTPQPAFSPFGAFSAKQIESVPSELLQSWRKAALDEKTSYLDTHPCLLDRLKAIGAEPEFSPPSAAESAASLLGPSRSEWEAWFDAQWREQVSVSWRKFHARAESGRARLAELRARGAMADLSEAQALELANLHEDVGEGGEAALAMRRALLAKYPDSLPVRFAIASQLLRRGEAEGVGPMEAVLSADPEAILLGAQVLRDYYASHNEHTRAQYWHGKYLERAQTLEGARQERAGWRLTDRLAPHELAAAELAPLITQLQAIAGLRRVYFVRKLTRHFAEVPLYLLGFKVGGWWLLHSQGKAAAAMQQIQQRVQFPGETLIVNVEGGNREYAKKLRRVRGSRLL